MRIAIVSDIHGNLTALEAVIADLRLTSPDLVLHGGDLSDAGSSPVEVIDLIRSLNWPGVGGNTDQMLATPGAFEAFAARLPALEDIWKAAREMSAFTRDKLGEERLAWLRGLPEIHTEPGLTLVHATPATRWSAPSANVADEQLWDPYRDLGPTIVYGHIHTPFVRAFSSGFIANSGSAGQPHDGDRRASYLLLDDSIHSIRRVEYDLDREFNKLSASGLPYAWWVKKILETASPQMP